MNIGNSLVEMIFIADVSIPISPLPQPVLVFMIYFAIHYPEFQLPALFHLVDLSGRIALP